MYSSIDVYYYKYTRLTYIPLIEMQFNCNYHLLQMEAFLISKDVQDVHLNPNPLNNQDTPDLVTHRDFAGGLALVDG